MRAIVIDGSRPEAPDAMATARAAVAEVLASRGWEVEVLELSSLSIAHCIGCYGCWVRTPGECVRVDDGRKLARAYLHSDLAALLTPVTFGGYSSTLKTAVERLLPLISPFFRRVGGEVHHRPRYGRYPIVVAVGLADQAEGEEADLFRALAARNALNLFAPAHAAAVIERGGSAGAAREAVERLLGRAGVGP